MRTNQSLQRTLKERSQKKRPQKLQRKSAVVNMRLPPNRLDVIDQASDVLGTSRTEFVLESAYQRAINVLIDQRLFTLSAANFEAFLRILKNPPKPTTALKKLLTKKSPWENNKQIEKKE